MFFRSFCFLFLLACDLHAEVKILEVVNGEVITNIDVEEQVGVLGAIFDTEITNNNFQFFFDGASEYLVNEALFNKRAKQLNLEVPQKELKERFEKVMNIPKLSDYIIRNNIDNQLIKRYIKNSIIRDMVINVDVVPYVTVNQQNVEDFKKKYNKEEMLLFELARVDGEKEDYLGLFIEGDLNPDLRKSLKDIGNVYNSIKLLDKLIVYRYKLESTFNFIKAKSDNSDKLNQFLSKNILKCDIDMTDSYGVAFFRQEDFKTDNSRSNNFLYKRLLSMSVNDISPVLKNDGIYTTLLLCGINNEMTDGVIKQKIFINKLTSQTTHYIKELKKNSSIISKK